MNQSVKNRSHEPRKHHLNFEQDDQRLRIGQDVLFCWSANGYSYEALAQVVGLSRLQITVVLLTAAGGDNRFRKGTRIQIPRYANSPEWSPRKSIRSIDENNRHKDYL